MSNTREKTLSKMSLKVLIWGYWADNGDRYPKEVGQGVSAKAMYYIGVRFIQHKT